MGERPAHRLTTQLPLLSGIVMGWLGLWWQANALVLDQRVSGYHWPTWLFGAWNHAHGQHHMLDPFRQPLHSALVGWIGQWTGLLDAALLVSGLSMAAVVAASGLTVRMLVGPWAGALAAAAIAWSPVATSGARWGTAYPLLTGALAVGIATTLWAARRRSLGIPAVAIAAAAAAVATMADSRGLLLLVVALPILAMRAARSWSGRALLAAVVLGSWIGTISAPWLGQSHSLSATEKRHIQTRVVARWTTQSMDTAMVSACRPVPQQTLLSPEFLTTPCARHVLRNNLQQALPGTSAWPIWGLGLALLGLVSPRRWRTDPDPPLLALGVLLATLATAVWTPLPARYQLVYTALSGLLVPLSLGWRLRERPRVHAALATGLLLLVVLLDPHQHNRHPVKGIDARWLQPADLADEVRATVDASTPVRDCAGTYVEMALMPDHSTSMGPMLSVPDATPCLHWIGGTSPRALLVRPDKTLPGSHGQVDIALAVAQADGWELAQSAMGVQLWVRQRSVPLSPQPRGQ